MQRAIIRAHQNRPIDDITALMVTPLTTAVPGSGPYSQVVNNNSVEATGLGGHSCLSYAWWSPRAFVELHLAAYSRIVLGFGFRQLVTSVIPEPENSFMLKGARSKQRYDMSS